MKYLFLLILSITQINAQEMLVLRGAYGGKDYQAAIDKAANLWQQKAITAKIKVILFSSESSKLNFLATLKKLPNEAITPLWIVFIGHGTFIDRQAKMNLNGDDLAAKELATALNDFKREVIFINTASASAPFLPILSRPGRIVITANQNASQIYFTKFNEFMAEAVANPQADHDKDEQTSLLESYLFASRKTMAFYDEDKRLRGEDSLLDDNGDKLGSSHKHYSGLQVKKPSMKVDGFRASQIHLIPSPTEAALLPKQRQERDLLEKELHLLKLKKSSLQEDDYYLQLETILRKLAKVYQF